jgi:3-isopropylmalate/(R)-2-methylmalate dehydratase large subunit
VKVLKGARTLYGKLWDAHVVSAAEGHPTVLYVDLHLLHDGTFRKSFEILKERNLPVARPGKTVGVTDHCVPSARPRQTPVTDMPAVVSGLLSQCEQAGIEVFGPDHDHQGIVHVIGPELGLTQPGRVIVCGDSHTPTHGAFGALSFAIGTTQIAHVLATQCVLQQRSKTMRVTVRNRLGKGVTSKDLILALIAREGVAAGKGYAVEYAGEAIAAMSMEERMTLCNMTAEMGARIALIAPDATTLAYLRGRPYAPSGSAWDEASVRWLALASDPDAEFDREIAIDAAAVSPMVTYGTTPGMGVPIDGMVPSPAVMSAADGKILAEALAYMGLEPGVPIAGHPVNRVFIGSCTNSRIEDLRLAASILVGRRVAAGTVLQVVPGSQTVKKQAEAEGLDRIFLAAGGTWNDPSCSLCVCMNGEKANPGEYVASTSNRNFPGRQGAGARTFLMSPAMAAATAISGRIEDPRLFANPQA